MLALIRRISLVFFLLYLLAVIWPGATLFSAAEPMVFGMPLSMAWPIAWIVAAWVVLLVLDHFENKGQDE